MINLIIPSDSSTMHILILQRPCHEDDHANIFLLDKKFLMIFPPDSSKFEAVGNCWMLFIQGNNSCQSYFRENSWKGLKMRTLAHPVTEYKIRATPPKLNHLCPQYHLL